VTLYQGDARRLPLTDASVHLIVTSPPYNARIAYDGYTDWLPWSEYWDGLIVPALAECFRVLAPGGRLCLNYANMVRRAEGGRPMLMAPLMWQALEALGFLPPEQLTWVKASHADESQQATDSTAWGSWCSASNPVLRAIVEPVFIASKGSYGRAPGPSDLTAAEFKAWTRNAWFITTGHAEQRLPHPATFPPELPRRLIKLFSYTTDTVLDPFAGAGTTLRVAKDLGRRAVGGEQSARYCRLAASRLAQHVLFAEGA
jgi:modification methylase